MYAARIMGIRSLAAGVGNRSAALRLLFFGLQVEKT